jgi:hypothetical protein
MCDADDSDDSIFHYGLHRNWIDYLHNYNLTARRAV